MIFNSTLHSFLNMPYKKLLFLISVTILLNSCQFFQSDETIAKNNIEKELRPMMRNPDSFVLETMAPLTPTRRWGTFETIVTYRAENGFGGMNKGMVLVFLSKNMKVVGTLNEDEDWDIEIEKNEHREPSKYEF